MSHIIEGDEEGKTMATGERFDRETKVLVSKEVLDKKRSVDDVAREFTLNQNTVRKWVRQYQKDPDHAFPGSGKQQSQGVEQDDVLRLRRRIKELEEENAFLQRVSTYFVTRPKNTCR